jgi:hypothetical protein
MKPRSAAGLVLIPSLFLAGCSPQSVAESLSTAQVCAESVVIAKDMREILVSTLVNPLAIRTYGTELGELLDQFTALAPANEELATAHEKVIAGIGAIVDIVEDPSVNALGDLPTLLAETQLGLRDFVDLCSL